MEIKINREIRNYQEAIFFGLTLRQFVFSVMAVGMAVGLYFGLIDLLGTEVTSWVCLLGAAPFAAVGFIRYNGLSFEQLVKAWFVSEILMPEHLTASNTENYFFRLFEQRVQKYKY
ncbi:PrgI family protein [Christensenellaceae bacterium OttesenSCG-928-M15]|nr:PrgI family protein [Christensenellaceae bacterium OttesenSCG-928-M15]